jgi:hypothetical protein
MKVDKFKYDFLDIHNDDLTPVAFHEGITVYTIDYQQAEDRMRAFVKRLIDMRLEREKNEHPDNSDTQQS